MKDQKKLLVLAGAGIHSKVVEAAREMGIYTIVADYLEDSKSPAKQIADEALMCDINDIETLVNYGREKQIDGVICFCCDPAQRPAQKVAEALGLPTFGSWEQLLQFTDKPTFKALCKANNVDTIPEYSLEDVRNDRVKYPVLVKPTDSRGSRGITICNSLTEVEEAVKIAEENSSNGQAIIERYMNCNQDLTISYLVKDGNPVLVSLGDRHSGRKEDNLDRQLSCTIQPSRFVPMYMKYVNDRVINMIKAAGIQNGPVFMQGFEDGNTVRMYDPGMRFPGNEYERIFAAATGMNLMKSIINYCVGGEILDFDGKLNGSHDLNNKCAIQYIINIAAGKVDSYTGLDEIAEHPCVVDVQQKIYPGAIVENTGDVRHRAGEISVLVERDVEKMCDMIDFIKEKLKITSVEGKNMLISQITTSFIKKTYGEK